MIIGSKNKGDWSEAYVLLYLLGQGNLYPADESLDRLPELFYPINKIFRQESDDNNLEFKINPGQKCVIIYKNDKYLKEMYFFQFQHAAMRLMKGICSKKEKETEKEKGLNIPESEKFLNDISCFQLSAPSNDITDITMELHDFITGINQIMGFSIKSYLGGAPTLLNASGATNFIYRVDGLSEKQKETINAINTHSKVKDKLRRIIQYGGKITYIKTASEVFFNNLTMIDSKMDAIVSEMLMLYYCEGVSNCRKAAEVLEERNPLDYLRKGLYTYKIKKFLCAKALGMEPGEDWSGHEDANGGYIVVKDDGDVLAYHLYNRNMFEDYLLNNTHIETASTTRHKFGSLYTKGNSIYINLALQIRFNKVKRKLPKNV